MVGWRMIRVVVSGVLALALAVGLAVSLDVARADAPSAEAATVWSRVTNGGGRCLENLNNAAVVNNKIQINVCSTAPAQQWSLRPDGSLVSPTTGCIEPYQSGTAQNTPVVLVVCTGSPAQQWTVTGGGLINKRTNKCLTYSGANANGSWAATSTCQNAAPFKWTVPAVSTPDAPTTTTPPATTTTTRAPTTTTTPAPSGPTLGAITNGQGKCLENVNNAPAVNNKVQAGVCSGAPAQRWSRWADLSVRTPAGACLEPYQGGIANGTGVVSTVCNGATSQQWQFVSNVLYNNKAQRCLQFQTTATAAWATIVACNTASAAQRWTVPPVSTTTPPPTTTTVPPTTTTVPPTTTTTDAPPTTTTTVPPTTTTTPAAGPPPFRQTGTTVWRADLTQADVVQAGFVDRSSNRQLCDGAYNNPNLPWPIKTQAAPGGRAGRAVPYTLPDCAIRLETEPNHQVFNEGDDFYFGFAFYLAPDFPLDTQSWQVIEQLHGAPGTGSPPVSFQAAKGGLLIDGGANKPGATSPGQYAYQKRLMNLEKGRWYNVVYRVTFSADPAKSWVSVWVDGQKVLENFQPPCATVYPPTSSSDRPGTYRKQGLYHFKDIPGGTIWQAGHKLGTGYDAADPSR